MPSSNSLVLPLVLWDNIAPNCSISSMLISENETNLITGTTSGHIIVWSFHVDNINPICLFMGHTAVVNCLAKGGCTKNEEYLISSSENGEMKLWEMNEKICLETTKTTNIHKNIYTTKLNGKYNRLLCIGNYTNVLVIDPMTLEVLYTLVSREQHQWINTLCVNSLPHKSDEVIVGISLSGVIKLWTIGPNEQKGGEIVEHEFKYCEIENARSLVSCSGKQRIFLVVCSKFFQIFDAFDFTILCHVQSKQNETYTTGYFISIDKIVVCTDHGTSYLYTLPDNANPNSNEFRQKVGRNEIIEKCVPTDIKFLKTNDTSRPFNPPVYLFYEDKSDRYLLRGDCLGRLCVWNLESQLKNSESLPDYTQSLQKFWHKNVQKDEEEIGHVSAFLLLTNLDRLIYGTVDGVIVILPALDYIIRRLFEVPPTEHKRSSKSIKLKRHTSKVTTLLYPNSENSRYDATLFVSGGADFSVILWNINTGDMIYRFVVQAGEILQLSIPPNNVNPRILQCICSIASDNSVALLSLKECKPVMVASRHLFPVLFIKWRPLDDYLIVKCTDGGVYVWQMETGNLDRVAHGLIAEDIISAADDINNELLQQQQQQQQPQPPLPPTQTNQPKQNLPPPQILSSNSIINQTLSILSTLHKRNFANSIKSIAQKALNREEEHKKGIFSADSNSINYPLVMQTFHFNTKDPVNNLLLFDVNSLLVNLMFEEQAIDALLQYMKTNFYKEIHNMQTAPSQLAPLYRTTPDHSGQTLRRNVSAKSWDPTDLKLMHTLKIKVNYAHSIIKITKILISCLHAWNLDEELDKLFVSKLGLYKPKSPISFGHISRHHHVTIMFPKEVTSSSTPVELNKQFDFNTTTTTTSTITQAFTSKEHWSISKCLTTDHLLSILAVANSYMSLQNFVYLQFKADCDALEFLLGDNLINPEKNNYGEEQAVIKQTYSRLSTMYCMLADYFTDSTFKPLNLELLANKWMDPSYEVREAAQSLLKNELKRIGPQGRAQLIKQWEPHLTRLLEDCEDISNNSHVALNVPPQTLTAQSLLTSTSPTNPPLSPVTQGMNINYSVGSATLSYSTINNEQQNAVDNSQTTNQNQAHLTHSQSIANFNESVRRLKRKQYVAIIIFGVMGAEFGQDVSTSRAQTPYKTIPKGFSIEDHTMIKRISIALAKLLTNKALGSDVIRRAAIDLMGRGFTIWEPFIQPTYVLLSLLELCADAELYIPRSTLNLPLTPIADTCRTARYSLNLIANTKPKTFILTIAKEVKRVNSSSAQTTQNSQANYSFNNALIRGKQEIIQVIEKLIDNQAQDVYELISDVIEIILYCLDTNQVRSSGLEEIFPPIFKFPMVRYCKETKKIIVGCHNGRLIMYEFRASKWHFQSFMAHNGHPIVSVGISPDSKYIASYSAHDNSLIIWQSTSGNIFNIGSASLKQHKACSAAPLDLNAPSTKLAQLIWQGKSLTLMYYDGRRFTYQI